MKVAKSSITRLIKKIDNEKAFDREEDLLGFEGISKSMLIDSLKESYGLLEGLSEKKETFDVIFMKRKLATLVKSCNGYLDDPGKTLGAERKFDDFLDKISKIRGLIKHTYLLVVEDCIREESYIYNIKADLEEHRTSLQGYIECKEEVVEASETVKTIEKELQRFKEEYEGSDAYVTQVVNEVSKHQQDIESSRDIVETAKEDIITTKSQILRNKAAYTKQVERGERLFHSIEKQEVTIQVQSEGVEAVASKLAEQQDSIQRVIDDANRASMAGSFLRRKNELDKPIRWSGIIMNVALIVAAAISSLLFYFSGFFEGKFDYLAFLTKIPIIAPFIWIAWTNGQRNSYLVRIREDYAFKYASAMAFEGYKKQVQEVDEGLQKRLLELAIENMGSNPIRIFDKTVKVSPAQELLAGLSKTSTNAAKKAESLVK
ncbi:hypothetical protein F7Q91_03220 [Vibrio chagasii]|uniref:Uncharacterized protein n=1 Tax=Vibrio chagasii TaxID=170679 RepID=A0A7V7NX25_9VIBR|nr:hypothetical protein [Vibrio chagasii]KAB0482433.1 hypothetical protein F7Q91_03220 [Vibrio chagasii]